MSRARWAVGAAAVLAVATGVVGWSAEPAFACHNPDGMISKQLVGGFKGDNVYNETGKHQTVQKTAAPGQVKKFGFEVHGDFEMSCSGGAVDLFGSPGGGCFAVRYFGTGTDGFHSAVDSTAAFVSVLGFPSDVAPMSDRAFRVEVKAKGCATPGSKKTVKIDAHPTKASLGLDFDRVRARVVVA